MKYNKGVFVESGHVIHPKRLTTQTYAEAMSSLIIVCADAVIISPKFKTIYLAKRRVSPMRGYWTIGGRRFAGESAADAVHRNLKRETGVDAQESRFRYVTTVEAIWNNRKEEPVAQGKHDLIQFFSIVLDEGELLKANVGLSPTEYEPLSLRAFMYDDLISEKVNPIIIEIYKKIFE